MATPVQSVSTAGAIRSCRYTTTIEVGIALRVFCTRTHQVRGGDAGEVCGCSSRHVPSRHKIKLPGPILFRGLVISPGIFHVMCYSRDFCLLTAGLSDRTGALGKKEKRCFSFRFVPFLTASVPPA